MCTVAAAEQGRSKIGAMSLSPELELSLHVVMCHMPRVGTCEKHNKTAMIEWSMPNSNWLVMQARVGAKNTNTRLLAYVGPFLPQYTRVCANNNSETQQQQQQQQQHPPENAPALGTLKLR